MPYIVTNSDGSLTVTVQDSVVDTSTYSLALIGRNVSNFGQYFAQNTIRSLENFASATAPSPSSRLIGQLWYDKNEEILRVWDGTIWKRATNIVVGDQTQRPDYALTGGGTTFFNTTTNKLEVHNGAEFREASYAGEVTTAFTNSSAEGFPTRYGTRVRNLFLKDDQGVKRPVMVMSYVKESSSTSATNLGHAPLYETIMALWSDAEFYIGTDTETLVDGNLVNFNSELTGTGGIASARSGRNAGQILPGMNIRAEYENTSVSSFYALFANTIGSDTDSVSEIFANTINVSGLLDLTQGHLTAQNADFNGSVTVQGNVDVESWINTNSLSVSNALEVGTSGVPATSNFFGTTTFTGATSANNFTVTSSLTANGTQTFTGTRTFTGTTTFNGTTTLNDNTIINGVLTVNGVNTQSIGTDAQKIETFFGQSGDFQNLVVDNNLNVVNIIVSNNTTLGDSSADSLLVKATSTFNSAATFQQDITANGDINSNGDIFMGTGKKLYGTATQAQYADLAEIYEADQDYAPGTVVMLGGEKEITQTDSEGSTEVFGVISTDPAYLMNSDAKGLPVAMTGRVPVKVIGEVKKGERLISSNVPGVAKGLGDAAYDPRMVIGRALESKSGIALGTIEAVIGVK